METEEKCAKLENQALLTKQEIINEAKEKAKTMFADFENLKKDLKKKALDEVRIKNDEQMKKEAENANKEIQELQKMVQEKEQGAIALVMSCIV